MKFNELITWNGLSDMHSVALHESEVNRPHKRGFVIYVHESIHCGSAAQP
jgi:hypothetical protein